MVKHLPHLQISPIGVVPQNDRRPHTIVDYTFSGVNSDTVLLCPAESMQFGRALDRILRKSLLAPPQHGAVYVIKVDIADGFYRFHLRPEQIPTLGVAYPKAPNGELLVAFPLTAPMGWVVSPPNFCGVTETITDITN